VYCTTLFQNLVEIILYYSTVKILWALVDLSKVNPLQTTIYDPTAPTALHKPEHVLNSGALILFITGSETDRDRVHAVALIDCTKTDFRSVDRCQRQETMRRVPTWVFVTLPFEHMAQMASTSSTSDLGAFHPESAVYVARHSAWDGWHEDNSQHGGTTHREENHHLPSKNAGQPQPLSNLVLLL
jgi:hypothetical protein